MKAERTPHPFWVIVQKEMADQFRSWRFIVLLAIMVLACIGSIYAVLANMQEAIAEDGTDFMFLKLFTLSQYPIPSFFTFISFLGPLLGIGLGFDAINSERNKGTLSRMLSQPIHRDSLLNAKFVSSVLVIAILFFSLSLSTMAMGLITLGIPPSPEEFWRILFFTLVGVVYVGFWLNLSILFSVRFRQPATSALSAISIWLFFSVFFNMIVELIATWITPEESASAQEWIHYGEKILWMQRISPSTLFSEATTTLLMPKVRSMGMITEDIYSIIPNPLPLWQSVLLVWPQLTGIVAATLISFAISYVLFMRQEIRSR